MTTNPGLATPQMVRNTGRGFASVTEANRARARRYRERILKLSLGGATVAQIAEATGLKPATVRDYRAALRKAGQLGCCMAASCRYYGKPDNCPWRVS